jgi:hypothetical protein
MKQLVIYLLVLGWCSSLAPQALAQSRRKGSSEAAMFRFSQPLAAGSYSFEPTGLFWFPQPSETQIKPEAFQPDAYFDQKAKPVKMKAGAVRYGAYLLTNGQEYLYALVNGEAGWLRAAVPVPAPLKAQYRTLLAQQRLRSSETGLKLGPEYGYVQITPFNDTNYVLIRNGFDNDFVLHVPTLRVRRALRRSRNRLRHRPARMPRRPDGRAVSVYAAGAAGARHAHARRENECGGTAVSAHDVVAQGLPAHHGQCEAQLQAQRGCGDGQCPGSRQAQPG